MKKTSSGSSPCRRVGMLKQCLIDWPVGAVGECVKAECSKELMLDEKYGYIH